MSYTDPDQLPGDGDLAHIGCLMCILIVGLGLAVLVLR